MLTAGARISNPASRRVLEKCGFQWTGVGLYRIRAIRSSAPFDRFRLERGDLGLAQELGARSRARRQGANDRSAADGAFPAAFQRYRPLRLEGLPKQAPK